MDAVCCGDAMPGGGRLRNHGASGDGAGGGCWGRGGCCWRGGCGYSHDDILHGGDVQSCVCEHGHGLGVVHAHYIRHDEGGWWWWIGLAEQDADAGTIDARGVGRRRLREYDAGSIARLAGQVGNDAHVEPDVADVEGGFALLLADYLGNGDALRAEALGDADVPLLTDFGAGRGRLPEDATGGNGGAVEAVLQVEIEAFAQGAVAGFGESETGKVGHCNFSAVDGQPHGGQRREQRNGHHGESTENDSEKPAHTWSIVASTENLTVMMVIFMISGI